MSEAPTPGFKLSYNLPEAAQAIGVGRSTIYEYVKAGRVQTFRLGDRQMIRADDLRAFIDRMSGRA